MKQTEKVSTQ